MKIIHISTSLNNGGLENMMVDIANEQYRCGYHVAIIVVNNKIDYDILSRVESGLKIFLIKRTPGAKSVYSFLKLYGVLKRLHDYDIIHSHGTYIGRLLNYMTRKRKIHTVHGLNNDVEPLKHYDQVIAISKAVKKDVELRCKIKLRVVYNGINTEKMNTRKLRRIPTALRFVNVSSLRRKVKGQDVLLYALNHLFKEDKIHEDIKLDFVGDGPSKGYLEELSEALGLNNIVKFIGNKPREWVYENLSYYDLFIQPSRSEGFGLTVVEAMTARVPVIVAHNDGPAEVTDGGKYGFIFENGNSLDLAEKIMRYIQLSKTGKIEAMVESAYKYCTNNFNIKTTAANYVREYELVLNR